MVQKPTRETQWGKCANVSHRKITWTLVVLRNHGIGKLTGQWLVSYSCFCLSTKGLCSCICLGFFSTT